MLEERTNDQNGKDIILKNWRKLYNLSEQSNEIITWKLNVLQSPQRMSIVGEVGVRAY